MTRQLCSTAQYCNRELTRPFGRSAVWLLNPLLLAIILPHAAAQNLMQGVSSHGAIQLLASDAAIIEIEEVKKDLPCTATQVKPVLGFDLRFHTGYDIVLPLREISGAGDQLTILLKVTPDDAKDSPVYFSQHYSVPEIEEDAKGDAFLQGGFDLGEGAYHVSFMMRDRMERVCSQNWDLSATLPQKDQGIRTAIAPRTIEASEREFFRDEPPVTRISPEEPLKVKILLNFSPQRSSAAAMQPIDTSALVSILRNISREPKIHRFSLVAFNMNDQKVVYRQEDSDKIDFPELGKALSKLKLGIVDYKKLVDKHSETDFLAKLLQDELGPRDADAVIFAGPKVMLDEPLPADSFKEIAASPFPVFYMNYILTPAQTPWRDSIGTVVKRMRGFEYTISRPRDLWNAWTDIMGRLAKMKLVATASTSTK